MIDHLCTYITVDLEYKDELFLRFLDSLEFEEDLPFTYYLKRLVMYRANGGASNKSVEILKKTIMVLIDELEKGN